MSRLNFRRKVTQRVELPRPECGFLQDYSIEVSPDAEKVENFRESACPKGTRSTSGRNSRWQPRSEDMVAHRMPRLNADGYMESLPIFPRALCRIARRWKTVLIAHVSERGLT